MEPRNVPKQLENPNFQALKDICKKYMESVVKYGSGYMGYYACHAFRVTIETLYGKDIWSFINLED